MKLGLVPEVIEGSVNGRYAKPDGITPRFQELASMAQAAESMGFDSFWICDHLLFRDPTHGEVGSWEAFTFLSGIAAATSRISLGPLVACMSFRNPALLAKMADSLDEISDGRFILGIGCGWHGPEYSAFGYPFDHRVSRFAEAIQIITDLLRADRSDFRGRYYQTDNAVLRPRGPSPSGPPIWVGAKRPRMLRLAARYADAWNMDQVGRPERVLELRRAMTEACAEIGRDAATLPVTAWTAVHITNPGGSAYPDPDYSCGTIEEVAELLHSLADAGIEHLAVRVRPYGQEGVERLARVRELMSP